MGSTDEQYFRKAAPTDTHEFLQEFTTDLQLDQQELKKLASTVHKWNIVIAEANDEESHRLFYRNIIRLRAVHNVPIERFSFLVKDKSLASTLMVEKLRAAGFTDFTIANPDNVIAEPLMEYGKTEPLFCSFVVAGLQFNVREDDSLWSQLGVGVPLRLEAEKGNVHDANAVAVCFEGRRLGYVPRSVNAGIAALLNGGWGNILSARVSQTNPTASYHSRLSVDVFVNRNDSAAPNRE